MGFEDDPHPEKRCMCTARRNWDDDPYCWPSDYLDRCQAQATTGGLCDHCREPHDPCYNGCCFGAQMVRGRVVEAATPCWLRPRRT